MIMYKQTDIFEAIQARDEGMKKAVDHADDVKPGWSQKAYELLLKFLSEQHGPFMAEDVRSFAAMVDFPLPPSGRAWGAVIVRASKNGLIKRSGYAPVKNVRAHMTPATLWTINKAS
jgi:hypothetical protein